MKQQLLLLMLVLLSPSLQAGDVRYYDVEVIIFEHLQAEGRNSEQWSEKLTREIPEALIEIGGAWPGKPLETYIPALSFTPLPMSKWQLKAEAEKIERSTSRRLLVHKAWIQPGLSQERAISVHFNQTILPAQNLDAAQATTSPALDSGTLDALIRVSLARYLRVETDLLFTSEVPAVDENSLTAGSASESEQGATPTPHYFHVQQLRRRIRSTELHYLDHPVLGMLIMFTPHKVANNSVTKKK